MNTERTVSARWALCERTMSAHQCEPCERCQRERSGTKSASERTERMVKARKNWKVERFRYCKNSLFFILHLTNLHKTCLPKQRDISISLAWNNILIIQEKKKQHKLDLRYPWWRKQIPKNLSEVDDDKKYFDYCLFDTFKVVSNNCINN